MVKSYTDLPEHVLDFLSSEKALEYGRDFLHSYQLSEEKLPDLMNIIDDIVLGFEPISSLPNMLEHLGMDASASSQAAVKLATDRLLPIDSVIDGGVASSILKWGGSKSSVEGVQDLVNDNPAVLSKSIIEDLSLSLDDRVLEHRLELIISDIIAGRLTDEEAELKLARPVKTGGLEMNAEDAGSIVAAVKDHAEKMGIFSGVKEGVEGLEGEEVKEGKEGLEGKEVTGEGKKKEIPSSRPTTEGQKDSDFEPESVPEEAIPPKPARNKSKEAKKPQKDIISDEDKREVAKMAEKAEEISKIPSSTSLEKTVDALAGSLSLGLDEERAKRLRKAIESRMRDVRDAYETRNQLEAPLDKGGVGLSGADLANTLQQIETAFDQYQKTAAKKVARPKAKPKAILKADQKMQEQADRMNGEALKQVVKATPKLSLATIPTQGKRQVTDVKKPRKLVGPVEEIRQMTLVEFRRLSKDAADAKRKILDKVDLLEEQGYENKAAAINAWRHSPLHKQYLELAQKALAQGASIEALLEKNSSDSSLPSKEELQAIQALNAKLRF